MSRSPDAESSVAARPASAEDLAMGQPSHDDPRALAALRAALSGPAPCVATIGTFDGVHAGHRALVAAAREAAAARGVPCVAVTFSPRPDAVLGAGAGEPDLCSVEERVARLRAAGADHVAVVPFTRALAGVSAAGFVSALRERLGVRALCVGEEFALGRGREGDVAWLRAAGLEVLTPPLVRRADGAKVSSSELRARRTRERRVA